MPRKNNKKNKSQQKPKASMPSNQQMAVAIGRAVGAAVGAKIGMPAAGAKLGGTAMSKLSRIVGKGDYEVGDMPSVNSLIKKGGMTATSSFGDDFGKSVRIRRREFVKNVISDGTDFSLDSILVQPGFVEPFPYCSTIAPAFKKYKINGLVYEFISNVSGYSSVPAMGAVVLAFDPNQGDEPPSNKVALENLWCTVDAKPDKNVVLGVECDPKLTPYEQYFVRTGDTPNTANVAEDFGKAYVGLVGLPTSVYTQGTVVGELWVTYDITFFNPAMPLLQTGFFNRYATSISTASIFGSSGEKVSKGGMLFDSYVDSANTNKLVFRNAVPGSVFVISMTWFDSTSVNTFSPTVNSIWGLQYEFIFVSNTGAAAASLKTGDNTSNCNLTLALRVMTTIPTTAGFLAPTLTMNMGGTLTSIVDSCNLQVYTLGQGMNFSAV